MSALLRVRLKVAWRAASVVTSPLGQLPASTRLNSGSRPPDATNFSWTTAGVRVQPAAGSWQVAHVRELVPRGWKNGLVTSIAPLVWAEAAVPALLAAGSKPLLLESASTGLETPTSVVARRSVQTTTISKRLLIVFLPLAAPPVQGAVNMHFARLHQGALTTPLCRLRHRHDDRADPVVHNGALSSDNKRVGDACVNKDVGERGLEPGEIVQDERVVAGNQYAPGVMVITHKQCSSAASANP